jgi:hypothetical protein
VAEAALLGSGRLTLLFFVVAAALLACNTRTPERWQLPDGYAGWVVIQYGNPACAALPVIGGYRMLRIPAAGRLCTSESVSGGEAFDKYEYVRSDGSTVEIDQRTLVHDGVVSSTGRRFKFIGTEQQFRSSPDTADALDERCTPDLRC